MRRESPPELQEQTDNDEGRLENGVQISECEQPGQEERRRKPWAASSSSSCGAACYACCGVMLRRHNFDAFLKRSGKRQPQELIRHWIRTMTRNSLLDEKSLWTVPITAEFKAAKKCRKNGLQLLRGWRAPSGENPPKLRRSVLR